MELNFLYSDLLLDNVKVHDLDKYTKKYCNELDYNNMVTIKKRLVILWFGHNLE